MLWNPLFVMLNGLAAQSHDMIRSVFWKEKFLDES